MFNISNDTFGLTLSNMDDGKRDREPNGDEDYLQDPKKPKKYDGTFATRVLMSRLQLRYDRMSWFLSKTYLSFWSPLSKFSTQWNNMVWLPMEHRIMVGGGLVASIATKLSMCAGSYKQPRENGNQFCGWMNCIMRRATTGLVRKMAKGYYEAGKALMFSQKFAMGARFLEKAIDFDHNGARALLAYYLMRGREGLPDDPSRVSDLASAGAANNCMLCMLIKSLDCITEVYDARYFGDSVRNAKHCFSDAMTGHMYNDDDDLAIMLYNLAQGMLLLPSFTRHCYPRDQTPESDEKALTCLLTKSPGIQNCEMKFRLGLMWWRDRHEHKKAVFYLENAAIQGHPEALYNLGLMYNHGLGVERDEEKGKELMNQATIAGNKSPENGKYKNH